MRMVSMVIIIVFDFMFIIIMRVEFLDCCSGDDHGQPINAPALMQEEYIEIEKKATPFTRYR